MFERTLRIGTPLLAAGLLAVGVAACGSSNSSTGTTTGGGGSSTTTSTSTTAALPASQQATSLKVGYTTDPENMPALIAEQQGFFKKNGLTVKLTPLTETSTLLPSLVSGEYDMLGETPTDVLLARAHGVDVSFIQGESAESGKLQDAGLVVAKDIKSVADLKGKKIAVPSTSGVLYSSLIIFLHQHGLSISDVSPVVEPLTEEGTLLQKGRVDAALTVQPFVGISEGQGFKNLGDPVTEAVNGKLTLDVGYAAATKFIQQNPQTIAKFLKSEDEAYAWMKAQPKGVIAALEKYFQLPAAVAEHYPLMPYIHLPVSQAELQDWVQPLVSSGQITQSEAGNESQAVLTK